MVDQVSVSVCTQVWASNNAVMLHMSYSSAIYVMQRHYVRIAHSWTLVRQLLEEGIASTTVPSALQGIMNERTHERTNERMSELRNGVSYRTKRLRSARHRERE